ncbi:translation initiation factor eIF 4e-like domain-containing protein [Mycena pura]|uniref:Translation initiation factor eIF 4e-like domain-containing protein n=1 Tax=Mycena pura TaxID=153505 RepID=A0AAD6YUG0_9AGAR|nr:translation initiation factor eIF 4e-like domain-containing protein [Mycena pura]
MSAAEQTKSQPTRLPSLNQLAARISASNGAAQSAAPSNLGSRPRLSAFTLRTTSNASNTSLSTAASTNDSVAVIAPTTRPASPSAPSSSSRSGTPSNDGVPGGDPNLTSEKLEKLNQETATSIPEKRPIAGYKNIPSLDAITARLAKARALSVDGTSKPPEPEMIEDPKTPGFHIKAPEHPLEYPWTLYHDTKAKVPFTPASGASVASSSPSATQETFVAHAPESNDYEAGLTVVGEFSTVEEFCRYFNWLKPPSQLERNSNYHLFKSGIKPMWEDEANANGGKWVLTMKNNPALLDRCWNWLAMALVGEELEEGQDLICGAVVSLRSKVDRIQVWTRFKDDVERLNAMGKKLVKLLDVSEADGIGLEFQFNSDDRPMPNKFLSIQSMPVTSYRPTFQQTGGARVGGHGRTESAGAGAGASPYTPIEPTVPNSAGPASGAFGSFGIGIGGTATWRNKPRP